MIDTELSSRYDASEVEAKWYQRWQDAGLFSPDPNSDRPKYTITIPPPNITGSLHMGHALCYPLQDVYGRYWRLQGRNVLVLPGQDHAGIAAQSVVMKRLKAEGIAPLSLGREKFVERVVEWRKESGGMISHQLRSLGCAFDWSRERYTLDDRYVKAVLKVFIDWFDRGLIYRGKRVINWDPVLQTSVSDIETERKTINGKLYHIRYPFEDGSGYVVIATTRPETMLADVAVAVHPSDQRYKGLVGKTLLLPLLNRPIPLIADQYPDPEFGTGAVKITPAHDPNDYEVGVRHGLDMPVVLDERAKVNELGGPYAGLDRFEARKKIVADLEELGLLEKIDNHEIPILVSERSGEVVEPLLSEQWFARQSELAAPVIAAVREGRVKFFPARYNRIFMDWMENIRDWCIGRQLWWGHRVPIYYDEQGKAYAALSWEEAEMKAGGKIVRQEEEVLDTWFSSGLWPFATLGWPEESTDLKERYPTSLLVTDRNIINLWVARMMMMGLDFMSDVPFKEVFIYATVMTEDGRRMSKSLGTGVDPMEVMAKIGADAMRYTLMSQAGENQEIRYSERRTEDSRNFCNKIWNAARFVIMNLDGFKDHEPSEFELVDRWILSRLSETEKIVRESYESYDIQAATQALYTFFWSELCDWYIEVSKKRLQDESAMQTPQWVLVTCIETFLKMLHPVMPHITEEIYHHLPHRDSSEFVMASSWPSDVGKFSDSDSELRVSRWFGLTRALRALRAEVELQAMKSIPVAYYEGDLDGGESVVSSQAWVELLQPGKPVGVHISSTVEGIDLHLPIEGLVDKDKEIGRIDRDLEKTAADLGKLKDRLSNPMFTERAKPEVVEREHALAAELELRLEKLNARRALFSD